MYFWIQANCFSSVLSVDQQTFTLEDKPKFLVQIQYLLMTLLKTDVQRSISTFKFKIPFLEVFTFKKKTKQNKLFEYLLNRLRKQIYHFF